MNHPIPLLKPSWPAPNHVQAWSTLRGGGHSLPPYSGANLGLHVGDDPLNVQKNRNQVQQQLDMPSIPIWLNQVHGTTVIKNPDPEQQYNADAVISTLPRQVLAIMTADCLPILLTNLQGTEIAAIHAGWRGLAQGIIGTTLDAMTSSPNEVLTWLGPCISQSYFEVGDEVHQTFIHQASAYATAFQKHPSSNRYYACLTTLARIQLVERGVQRIFFSNQCTFHQAEAYFSYRRDRITGRMASFIWF